MAIVVIVAKVQIGAEIIWSWINFAFRDLGKRTDPAHD
ncbi:hypothetical protein PSYAR_12874 [Pseudomonas syringae pv. aceris str. M302273]|nr:hypothetical protein PSYAR_12874 [Pseudomonas syringae pv. aceris str. M302273]